MVPFIDSQLSGLVGDIPKALPQMDATKPKFNRELWNDSIEHLLKEKNIKDSITNPWGLLANIMGDAFLHGVSMNQELAPEFSLNPKTAPLEGTSFEMVANSLLSFLKAKTTLLEARDKEGRYTNTLKKVVTQLDGAIQFHSLTQLNTTERSQLKDKLEENEELAKKLDEIIGKIKGLKTDEELVIPGGWIGKERESGHAMLYVLRRQPDGNFTLIVINSGDGLETHQSVFEGIKKKKMPVRIFRNLPACMVTSREPWVAYLKLLMLPPVSEKDSYKSSDVYKHLLPSLGATEEQELSFQELDALGIKAITPQRAGTCAADSLFAWLKILFPSEELYKTIKLEFKGWIFAQCMEKLEEKLKFSDSTKLSDVPSKKGDIHFVRAITEKFAISVKKSLERQELTLEEADRYTAQIDRVLKFASTLDNKLNKLMQESHVDRTETLNKKAAVDMACIGHTYKEVQSKIIADQDLLKPISSVWPASGKVLEQLQAWSTSVSKCKDTYQKHLMLYQIIKNMPSVSQSGYWEEIPMEQREECMVAISQLSHQFFNTSDSIKGPKHPRIEYILYMQHVLVVMRKLSTDVLDKENKFSVYTSRFSHQPRKDRISEALSKGTQVNDLELERPASGYHFIHDPKLEQKFTDALVYLYQSDKEKLHKNTLFQGDIADYLKDRNRRKLVEINPKDSNEWPTPEEIYVKDYFSKHEEIKQKIVNDIQSSGVESPTESFIIAYALTHDYLPKSFYALRLQALVTNCFCQLEDYSSFSKIDLTKWSINPESLKEHLQNSQAKLLLGPDTIGPLDFEVESGNRRYQNSIKCLEPELFSAAYDAIYPPEDYSYRHGKHDSLNSLMLSKDYTDLQKELAQLAMEEDKSQQAVKTIVYCRKQLNDLFQQHNQLYFQMLMFERGVLRNQLKAHPDFSLNLLEFVNEGLARAELKKDISASLFFLRMGDYLGAYCKACKAAPADFPNLWEQSEKLLAREDLSNEDQWLILRDQLAYLQRHELLPAKDIGIVLKKYINLRKLQCDDFDARHMNLPLDDEISQLAFDMAASITAMSDEEQGKLLSEVVGSSHTLQWKIAGKIASTVNDVNEINGDYQIDLLDGRVYQKGYASISTVPQHFLNNATFREAFGDSPRFENISANGPNDISFTDRFGHKCFAKFINPKEISIQKMIGDELCLYMQMDRWRVGRKFHSYLQNICMEWHSTKLPHKIYFLDKDKGHQSYAYNPDSKLLEGVSEGPCKGLFLVNLSDVSCGPFAWQLTDFDECAMMWVNKENKAEIVELPRYGIKFKAEWTGNSCKLNALSPYEGFHLTDISSLPLLHRYKGCLMLQNDDGEQRVLIPNRTVQDDAAAHTFDQRLAFEDNPIKQNQKYYEYIINEFGHLDAPGNLEAQLYLAYLYKVSRNYHQANILLSRPTMKPPRALTERECELLGMLTNTKNMYDHSPQALAIVLKAYFLEQEDRRRFHDFLKKPSTEVQTLIQYLSQLKHIPEEFFGVENEMDLLEEFTALHMATQIPLQRRKNALRGTVSEEHLPKEKAATVDKDKVKNPATLQYYISKHRLIKDREQYKDLKGLLDSFPALFYNNNYRNSWSGHFYLLYEYARDEKTPLDDPQRLRLLSQMHLHTDSRDQEKIYREILIAVTKYPSKMPSADEITDPGKYTQDLLPELYAKAYELNHQASAEDQKPDIFSSLPASKHVVRIPAQKPVKHPAAELPALFPESLFGGSQSLFIKADARKVSDNKELSARLMAAEEKQKNRVERRLIRELREDVAIDKDEAVETWVLQEGKLEEFETVIEKQLPEELELVKKARRAIVKLANKRASDPIKAKIEQLQIKGGGKRKLSIGDLLFAYIKNDLSAYREKNPNLTVEDAQQLHAQLKHFMMQASRVEQLKQVRKKLRECKRCPKTAEHAPLLQARTQELAKAIKVSRAYTLDDKHAHVFLVFEYLLKALLRPEQVASMSNLTEDGVDVMLQLIMGGGKTDFLAPLLAYLNADGDHASILMVPEELVKLVGERLWQRSGKGFRQVINRLNAKDWSNPKKIYERLEELQRKRDVLLVTDKEIHDLNLRIMEMRTKFCRSAQRPSAQDEEQFNNLQKIKAFLKTKAKGVIDESHKIFDCRHDSRIALNNDDNKVNVQYLQVAVTWFQQLLANEKIRDSFNFDFVKRASKAIRPFSLSDYEAIKDRLIKNTLKALSETDRDLSEQLAKGKEEEIVKFLSANEGDKVNLPEGMGEALMDKMCFLRSECLISPSTWNSIPKVRYGLHYDAKGPSLLAGPYESAHQPKLGSQFAHLTELINYTIQTYLLDGIGAELLQKELKRIEAAVDDEMQSSGITIPAETEAYQEYIQAFGKEWTEKNSLFESGSKTNLQRLHEHIHAHPNLLLHFLEKYILPQIPIYTETLVSDGQLLADMFAHAVTFTGTPNVDDAPDRFKPMLDKGTDGKMIKTLWNNSRDNVHILKEETDGIAILKEMLSSREIRAIIDAGALFKDVHQLTLAREVLRLRDDIQAVIYFDGNQKMVLKRDAEDPVPESLVKIPLDKRFTIYDQSHCIGTDIDQWPIAHAAITMHKNLSFRNFAQAAARMRGIFNGQVIHLFITPSQKALIEKDSGQPMQNILDPILYMVNVQAKQQAVDAVITIKQKMRKLLVQACEQMLDSVPVHQLNTPELKELNDILIVKIPKTFLSTYRYAEEMKDDRLALEAIRDQILKPLTEWQAKYKHSHYSPDKDKLILAMGKIIDDALVKDKEKINDQIPVNTTPETGRSMAVTVTAKADTNHQQTTESETETDTESLSSLTPGKLVPAEVPTLGTYRMFEKGLWFNLPSFEEDVKYSKEMRGTTDLFIEKGHQPMIRANDLMHLLKRETAGSTPFHPNLYLSYQCIATEKDGIPLGKFQKPIGPCLIIQDKDEPKKFSFVLISPAEAEEFKKALLKDKAEPHTEGSARICLYYLGLGSTPEREIYQQGSDPISPKDLADSPDFQALRFQCRLWSSDIHLKKPEIKTYFELLSKVKTIKPFHDFYKGHLLRGSFKKAYPQSSLHNRVFAPLLAVAA